VVSECGYGFQGLNWQLHADGCNMRSCLLCSFDGKAAQTSDTSHMVDAK